MALSLVHAFLCLALAATAGEPRTLKEVIADLGARDYKTREAASDELAIDKTYTLAQIEGALKDSSLSPEQRLRLERAGLRKFKDAPHGALGVEFAGTIDRAEIGSVKKNFPSSATLKAGDVITQIDGETVSARVTSDSRGSTVRVLVISHDPGDEVPMVVQRAGVPVKLTVKFGDFKDLGRDPAIPGGFVPTPYIDESEALAAWQQRLKRSTGRAQPAPIDAGALRPRRESGWGSSEPYDAVETANRTRVATGDIPPVTAGATPDADHQIEHADQAMNGGGGGWPQQGFGRAFNGNARQARIGNGLDQQELSKQSDAELAADRLRLVQWRMSFIQVADAPGIDRAQRQQFRLMEDQILQQLAQVDREIERRKINRQPARPEVGPLPPPPPPVVKPDVAPDDAKPDQKGEKR